MNTTARIAPGDHRAAVVDHPADDRRVRAHQHAVDRVAVLAEQPPAHEDRGERWRQRHREQRGEPHRVGLGERERLEQPALGALEREDREERHRDHEQREEDRRPDLLHRRDHRGPPRRGALGRRRVAPLAALPVVELLVDVLDDDDRRVDHRADRDHDPTERHDVGGQVLEPHRDEREQDAERQRQDRDQRAADVEQEHEDDQRDHDHLLDQRPGQRRDRRADQLGAIVGDLDRDAVGQRALELREPPLDAVDHVERVLAVPHDHDAADHLAFAVELGDAAPDALADRDLADVAHAQGDAAAVARSGTCSRSCVVRT